jgi:alpha-tubulin suppressor-like RCC1 family protein
MTDDLWAQNTGPLYDTNRITVKTNSAYSIGLTTDGKVYENGRRVRGRRARRIKRRLHAVLPILRSVRLPM